MQEHKSKQSPGKGTEEPSEGHRADRISIRLRKFPVPKIDGCWKGTRGTRCFMLAAIFFSSPGDGGCQEGAGCTQQGLGCSPLLGATHPCTVLLKENTLPVHFFSYRRGKNIGVKQRAAKNMVKSTFLGKGKRLLKCWQGSCPPCCPRQAVWGGGSPPAVLGTRQGAPGAPRAQGLQRAGRAATIPALLHPRATPEGQQVVDGLNQGNFCYGASTNICFSVRWGGGRHLSLIHI